MKRLRGNYGSVDDVVFKALCEEVGPNPQCGSPIRHFAGRVRKLRLPNPDANRGKSGGFRLIYDWNEASRVLWLVAVFSKSETDDLADREIVKARKEAGI